MKNKVEIITCPEGDWTIVKLNDKDFYSGHEGLPNYIYNLLRDVGVEVVDTEISDEEMEMMC